MPSPAGRKKVDPEVATAQKILTAAVDVFAELGYEGTSFREICKRARVNSAAINYHWRSKEQLWIAVREEVGRQFQSMMADAITPGLSVRETLQRFLSRLFDVLVGDQRPGRILVWSALQSAHFDYETAWVALQPALELAVGYCRAAQSAGEIAAEVDVPVALLLIYGQLVYVLVDRAGHRRYLGQELSNPEHAERVRAALIRSALLNLGLQEAPETRRKKKR